MNAGALSGLSWLVPVFRERQRELSVLAPAHRFGALIDVVAHEHADRVGQFSGWNLQAQTDLLAWLEGQATGRAAAHHAELWTVRRDDGRTLRCVVVTLPSGRDVRLLEGADFVRTELAADEDAARVIANRWRGLLAARGWR